jgi:hypothetical protein
MLDVGLNLVPDRLFVLNNGSLVSPPQDLPRWLPDSNTRLVAISESDLAIILAMLSEPMADYVPINLVAVSRFTNNYCYPSKPNADYQVGDVVKVGARDWTVSYVGDVEKYDTFPLTAERSRALLRERLAIIRERLMVDLTAYMTRIAEAIEGIEEELGDATDAMERIAVAVESQTTSEGLDDIASAVGALAPLVALI